MLADKGIKEIILLGQNVSAYGLDQSTTTRPEHSPFAELLTEVNNIEGIKRFVLSLRILISLMMNL